MTCSHAPHPYAVPMLVCKQPKGLELAFKSGYNAIESNEQCLMCPSGSHASLDVRTVGVSSRIRRIVRPLVAIRS